MYACKNSVIDCIVSTSYLKIVREEKDEHIYIYICVPFTLRSTIKLNSDA